MKLKNIFLYILICVYVLTFNTYCATIDYNLKPPTDVQLTSDGHITWQAETSQSVLYKKFHVRLVRRSATTNASTGITTYTWSDYGSIKSADGTDRSTDINISASGVYHVKVRAVNSDGNYSTWTESTTDVAVEGSGSGGGGNVGPGWNNNWNYYGPGSINNNSDTSLIIGPDGSIYYNKNYNNNPGIGQGINYNQPGQSSIGQGPGYNTNNQSPNSYGPGINNNQSSNINNIVPVPNIGNNTNQNNNTNINVHEVGWHVVGNNRMYYQNNGTYIANAWADIGGNYYRFDSSGYMIQNQWFKDPTNNLYYYLGTDGKMLTGWQKINGIWYYFNPNKGTGYGTMYSNCVMTIDGKTYAFDTAGAMVQNAWFNGAYYGASGEKTN